jgi:hypothetical protein
VITAPPLTLTDAELVEATGYRQPAAQLRALHALGFWLARRSPLTGHVILDRAHYEALCQRVDRADTGSKRKAPILRAV